MREKKQLGPSVKRLIIIFSSIGVLFYLVLVYYLLHFMAIKTKYPRKSLTAVMMKANEQWLTDPAAILPLNISHLGVILAITLGTATFAYMKYKMSHYLDVDNPDTVMGSDHFMTRKEKKDFDLKYADPIASDDINGFRNMILSKDMRLMLDNRKTDYNANVLAIGGSGSGKSFYFAGPNILQANANFIITDPKGDLLKKYGKYLENQGYKVSVYNISDMTKSNHFNPFVYCKDEEDIVTMVDIVLKNTDDTKDAKSQKDPFWDSAMKMLLTAIATYLWQTEDEEKTWSRVIDLVRAAHTEGDEPSQLDLIFKKLKADEEHRNDFCVRQYENFLVCGDSKSKTRDNILVTCTARLQNFDLQKIKDLTAFDDLDLENFANEKRALFVVIPSYKDTFNFIVSLMYSQLFNTLYRFSEQQSEYCSQIRIPSTGEVLKVFKGTSNKDAAKALSEAETFLSTFKTLSVKRNKEFDRFDIINKRNELIAFRGTKEDATAFAQLLMEEAVAERCIQRLPNHTRFVLDEFANLSPIPRFPELLSTMRSYELSSTIILQSLAQLKKMYEHDWQTISGNCDTTIYLGGNETETTKWLSQEIGGKRTARVMSENYQAGNTGSSSGVNLSGVELLGMCDLRQMKKDECIVIVRGMPIHKGKKYAIKEHPMYEIAQKTHGQFELRESEQGKRILKRLNRKKRPLSKEVMQSLNKANAVKAAEYRQNKDAITGKPLVSHKDALEAIKSDKKLRMSIAQLALDSTGHEDILATDLLEYQSSSATEDASLIGQKP